MSHFCTVPPRAPANVSVSDISPFSATVSWQPPLDDGGAVGPLTYTVTMNMANLRHSVNCQLQVVAGNEARMGQTAAVMFRTN